MYIFRTLRNITMTSRKSLRFHGKIKDKNENYRRNIKIKKKCAYEKRITSRRLIKKNPTDIPQKKLCSTFQRFNLENISTMSRFNGT